MAAYRPSYRLDGRFRKMYRSFNTYVRICHFCWERSINIKPFPPKENQLHTPLDDNMIRFSCNDIAHQDKKWQHYKVSSECTIRIGRVDIVKSIRLSILEKQITSVLCFNNLSQTTFKYNSIFFVNLRHFCTSEFRVNKDKIGEEAEVRGHRGSVKPFVNECDLLTAVNDGDNSPNCNTDQYSDLLKSPLPASPDNTEPLDSYTDQYSDLLKSPLPASPDNTEPLDSYTDQYSDLLKSPLPASPDNTKPLDSYTDQYSDLLKSPLPASPFIIDSYNLAPFVPKSDVLKYLVQLNVNLGKVETIQHASNSLVKLNLEQDVMPVMVYLKEAGIPDVKFGKIIGCYPFIFEYFDDAKLVMEFFKYKKFKKDSIAKMVAGAPNILGLKAITIDTRIGVYQNYFDLTGNQTRNVMTRVPRILLNKTDVLKETIAIFQSFNFSKDQMKSILLQCPSVFKRPEEDKLQHRLNFLLMKIPMDQSTITNFSFILRYPSNPIKERHLFLLELGRAQYDPTKEHYISPVDLVCTPEAKFCKLARSTPVVFKEFKMTL